MLRITINLKARVPSKNSKLAQVVLNFWPAVYVDIGEREREKRKIDFYSYDSYPISNYQLNHHNQLQICRLKSKLKSTIGVNICT